MGRKLPLGGILPLLLAIVVGLSLAGYGANLVVSAQASRSWPAVAGVVEHSSVSRETDGEGHDHYELSVRYRYEVGERTYTGRDVDIGGRVYSDAGEAEQALGRYPEGRSVEVFHDPDRPHRAVLEPGGGGGGGVLIFGGLFFVALGSGFLWMILSG